MENRFTDNGDDTVTDAKTGLTWMKEDDGEERTWKDAMAYCEALGDGWRMPTIEELFSIIDFSRHGPAIDPIFTNAKSDWYWSSTPRAGLSLNAWFVDFSDGSVDWVGVYSHGYVRPVRQNSL